MPSSQTELISLSSKKAAERLLADGENSILKPRKFRKVRILLKQFVSSMMLLLIAVSILLYFTGDLLDSSLVFMAVIINVLIGFLMEYKADNSIEALKNQHPEKTYVYRDSKLILVESRFLVVGDLVEINSGEKIGADGDVVTSQNLYVDESPLTGESRLIDKNGKDNKVYGGTTVMEGKALIRITATGFNTEFGKIAHKLSAFDDESTPIMKELSDLGRKLTFLGMGLSLSVFVIGYFGGFDVKNLLLFSITIGIASVPEGLLVVISTCLARAIHLLGSEGVIIRKLSSLESLGQINTILTDKTGTLTHGTFVIDEVSGDKEKISAISRSVFEKGNLTDKSLLNYFKLDKDTRVQTFDHISFNSSRKFMATKVKTSDGYFFWVKGAPHVVLEMIHLTTSQKQELSQKLKSYEDTGRRLLIFAQKKVTQESILNEKDLHNFTYVGFVSLADKVRASVQDSIESLHKMGMKIVVITGDSYNTAKYIISKIGLKVTANSMDYSKDQSRKSIKSFLVDGSLIARATPTLKFEIVSAFKEKNNSVLMLGDGINDALALKNADVAVVVGEATTVSKEVADVILTTSDFNLIIKGIIAGRGVIERIRRITLFLLSDSLTILFIVLFGFFLNHPLPITPLQILWLNIITDTIPALGLAFYTPSYALISRPPEDFRYAFKGQSIFLKSFIYSILFALVHLLSLEYISTRGITLDRFSYTFLYLSFATLIFALYSPFHRGYNALLSRNKILTFAVCISVLFVFVPFYFKNLASFLSLGNLVAFEVVFALVMGMVANMLIILFDKALDTFKK